jgi:hypothetical protein
MVRSRGHSPANAVSLPSWRSRGKYRYTYVARANTVNAPSARYIHSCALNELPQSLRAAAEKPTMLELVVALKLLAQQAPDHVAHVQQNAQLRLTRAETTRTSQPRPQLSAAERQELRAECERFVAEQPGKVIDLRKIQ